MWIWICQVTILAVSIKLSLDCKLLAVVGEGLAVIFAFWCALPLLFALAFFLLRIVKQWRLLLSPICSCVSQLTLASQKTIDDFWHTLDSWCCLESQRQLKLRVSDLCKASLEISALRAENERLLERSRSLHFQLLQEKSTLEELREENKSLLADRIFYDKAVQNWQTQYRSLELAFETSSSQLKDHISEVKVKLRCSEEGRVAAVAEAEGLKKENAGLTKLYRATRHAFSRLANFAMPSLNLSEPIESKTRPTEEKIGAICPPPCPCPPPPRSSCLLSRTFKSTKPSLSANQTGSLFDEMMFVVLRPCEM